jgi:hypothetical protein
MIIQKDSWHYRLVTNYSGQFFDFDRSCYDSCSYIRRVAWAAIRVIFFTIVGGVGLGITVGDFLAWIVAMVVSGSFIDVALGAAMTIAIIGLAICLVIASAIMYVRDEYFPKSTVRKPPGFFKQAYERAHNKYCSKLEVV